jgi:hypothetical protein
LLEQFGVKVVQESWRGFGPQKQFAIEQAARAGPFAAAVLVRDLGHRLDDRIISGKGGMGQPLGRCTDAFSHRSNGLFGGTGSSFTSGKMMGMFRDHEHPFKSLSQFSVFEVREERE